MSSNLLTKCGVLDGAPRESGFPDFLLCSLACKAQHGIFYLLTVLDDDPGDCRIRIDFAPACMLFNNLHCDVHLTRASIDQDNLLVVLDKHTRAFLRITGELDSRHDELPIKIDIRSVHVYQSSVLIDIEYNACGLKSTSIVQNNFHILKRSRS